MKLQYLTQNKKIRCPIQQTYETKRLLFEIISMNYLTKENEENSLCIWHLNLVTAWVYQLIIFFFIKSWLKEYNQRLWSYQFIRLISYFYMAKVSSYSPHLRLALKSNRKSCGVNCSSNVYRWNQWHNTFFYPEKVHVHSLFTCAFERII